MMYKRVMLMFGCTMTWEGTYYITFALAPLELPVSCQGQVEKCFTEEDRGDACHLCFSIAQYYHTLHYHCGCQTLCDTIIIAIVMLQKSKEKGKELL